MPETGQLNHPGLASVPSPGTLVRKCHESSHALDAEDRSQLVGLIKEYGAHYGELNRRVDDYAYAGARYNRNPTVNEREGLQAARHSAHTGFERLHSVVLSMLEVLDDVSEITPLERALEGTRELYPAAQRALESPSVRKEIRPARVRTGYRYKVPMPQLLGTPAGEGPADLMKVFTPLRNSATGQHLQQVTQAPQFQRLASTLKHPRR